MFALRRAAAFRPVVRPMSARFFNTTRITLNSTPVKTAANLAEVVNKESLIGQGAKEGTIPTDLEQATGLERLELLGKLEGIDIFDTKPLDSSRIGTVENPIMVDSFDDYRYIGCTGSPADSHEVQWMRLTGEKLSRCWECGSVYKLNECGVPQDDHHH
ncbi:cytochrome c oxidase subunit IV [Saccharomycopsis crataegensis]|uniref:Cytochrome c oxidase subunit 4, mitochondrial n=1 Tax=Saccharomycopsis crataegensis TaxID=43959 RepID=A0AAV5QT49_9ASCO|nr:cytochrome c oxidase subunit IV [Saccharomycopsis crataegensis]